MSELIDRQAFIENERKLYCEDCDRRKGTKNGKPNVICYEIGEAPCRACWLDDALTDLEDFPTAAPCWHRVDEPPKKTAKYLVWVDVNNGVFVAYPELRTATYNVVYERWYVDGDQRTEWIGTPRYWMPIEPPKEDA